MEKVIKALLSNNFKRFEREHKYYSCMQRIKFNNIMKDLKFLEYKKFLISKNYNLLFSKKEHINDILITIINNKNIVDRLFKSIHYIDCNLSKNTGNLNLKYLYKDKFIVVSFYINEISDVEMELHEYFDLSKNINEHLPTIYKYDMNQIDFELARLVQVYYRYNQMLTHQIR